MKQKDNIWKELSEVSPFLAAIDKANPNTIPEGYFAQFPAQILSLLKQYEDQNTDIRAELAQIAPLLNTIGRYPVQSVPVGYFAQVNFAKPVLKQTKKSPKLVSIPIVNRWMQLSAAAVIAGIFITGAFMFTNKRENYTKYEGFAQMDISSELQKISEAELEKYLFEPEHIGTTQLIPSLVTVEDIFDVNSNIQFISDEALTQYITANSEPDEKPTIVK